ncbi:NADH:ubiquinone reductase (Na(+)-transporting) subunit B [Brumimicrobium salinarum]|uniref:Na(+)-translocating NADH-quinone reductase subunit B n=1 Tax=Brumimicrobium salinarum TaxID=2058658 RepID=A0A2I0R2B9_9FLAO|nr:NADH:ubiquinone reductase (Na(+)-transporting) subunit B [Brumimicrobium salinarum]PKR80540.1 NADH:ubiquinone reductase (Na(+)-transporting) subunit B [Brumimicrobium salinarum]
MKALKKVIHNLDPKFEKGGKWEKAYPLYETLSTFLFTPKHVTKKGAHIRDGVDLKRTMFMVVLALIPALLFGIYNTGHWHYELMSHLNPEEYGAYSDYLVGFGDKVIYGLLQVLPLIIVSYAVGLAVEFIFGFIRGHGLHEGFLVSGMLIPLTMPADVPLWMVGVATAFAVVIGKEVFGGTGMNIVNIALTARAFLFFAYPTAMSGDKVWKSGTNEVIADNGGTLPDGASGATALGDMASLVGDAPVVAGEVLSSEAGSAELIQKFENAYDPLHAIIGMIPGSIGETSIIAILLGAALLLYTGVASWRIILSFFAGGLVFGLLMNLIGANAYMDMPAWYHLILGGFAFGAVFMATDPVTAAQTQYGKLWYGFLGGGLAVLIRVLNPAYPEGVMLAILFMNIMAPLIDHYVVQVNISRRKKRFKTA